MSDRKAEFDETQVAIAAATTAIEAMQAAMVIEDGETQAAIAALQVATEAITAAIEALPLDTVTGALRLIDVPHDEIHQGNSFNACYLDTDVDDAATVNLRLVAPDNDTRVHLFFDVTGTLATTWQIFEDCTHNAGTEVTAYNKDRNNGNSADLVVTHTASGDADGTQLDAGTFGDGKKSGGQERGSEEFILDQGKVYLLKATSHAANNRISIRARWYEED